MLMITLFALLLGGGAAFAQNGLEKTKKLTESEVPVAVMKSFQKDYNDLQDKGYWKLHYTERTVEGKSVFTPERYTFNGKKDGEKIVLTYTTDGNLESTKGAGAKN